MPVERGSEVRLKWLIDIRIDLAALPNSRLCPLHYRPNMAKICLAKIYVPVFSEIGSRTKPCNMPSQKQVSQRAMSGQSQIRPSFIRLFTNLELLEKIAESSNGVITSAMIKDLISHAYDQLGQRPEDAYSGYESDALETVDGKNLIDDEAEQTISGTIDPEDFALLLELQAYKSGKQDVANTRIKKYSHMVIDEAQDLAVVELKALSRALEDDAAITIAGDAAQQIDPTHSFESWERVLDTLNQPRVYANYLTTTYRSPKTIADFAHGVLGPIAPAEPPTAIREGLPVARTLFPNEGQMVVFLTETLNQLMTDEPLASVAVLTKGPEYAIALYKLLKNIPKVRLVEHGEFEFKAGIDITSASEVKGLEFDYVIIPDASRGVYIDKPEDRRLMHVAATRAIHQLWVISVGYETSILPAEA